MFQSGAEIWLPPLIFTCISEKSISILESDFQLPACAVCRSEGTAFLAIHLLSSPHRKKHNPEHPQVRHPSIFILALLHGRERNLDWKICQAGFFSEGSQPPPPFPYSEKGNHLKNEYSCGLLVPQGFPS